VTTSRKNGSVLQEGDRVAWWSRHDFRGTVLGVTVDGVRVKWDTGQVGVWDTIVLRWGDMLREE
jgi:hypothetical protein